MNNTKWERVKKCRILLYGTGKKAREFLQEKKCNVLGVLDRFQQSGDFCGYSIVSWDDVEHLDADIVLIASSPAYYQEIYERIVYRCLKYHLGIWTITGEDMIEKNLLHHSDKKKAAYFRKNEEELKNLIDCHEAISFDMFDTLVVRKVFEPIDVFDLVEQKAKDARISADNYKLTRHETEIKIKDATLSQIYAALKEIYHWTEQEKEWMLQQEIVCEKQVLIPREVMVNALKYAVAQKKKVSIISDMYLSSEILKELLMNLGISGYDKLYVSCEYQKGKETGLFDIYKQDVQAASYLHIGDNRRADIEAAKKYGIDTYEIYSPAEMLKLSNFNLLLTEAGGNHFFLGLLLADLFNNPFALEKSGGVMNMHRLSVVVRAFWLPCVIRYMKEIMDTLSKEQYKGILFGARDGYLFKKIFDEVYSKKLSKEVESHYFLASRALALKAVANEESTLDYLKALSRGRYEDMLNHMFSSENYDEEAIKTQKNYRKYIVQSGIDFEAKYIWSDLISGGTVHSVLNQMFANELDGVYLARMERAQFEDLHIHSAIKQANSLFTTPLICFFEKVFTAPTPSVMDMDDNGQPIYEKEIRTDEDMKTLQMIQDEIFEQVREVVDIFGLDLDVTSDFLKRLLPMFHEVEYCEGVDFINNWSVTDDLSKVEIPILQ